MFNFFKTNTIHFLKAFFGLALFVSMGILSYKLYLLLIGLEFSHIQSIGACSLLFGIGYWVSIYQIAVKNKLKTFEFQELPKGLLPALIFMLALFIGGITGLSFFTIGKIYHLVGFVELMKCSPLPPLLLMYMHAGSIFYYSKKVNAFNEDLVEIFGKFCVVDPSSTFKKVSKNL